MFIFQSNIDHSIILVEKIDRIAKNSFQIRMIDYFCLIPDDFHILTLSRNNSIHKHFIVEISLYPIFFCYQIILRDKFLRYCYQILLRFNILIPLNIHHSPNNLLR